MLGRLERGEARGLGRVLVEYLYGAVAGAECNKQLAQKRNAVMGPVSVRRRDNEKAPGTSHCRRRNQHGRVFNKR